jgi:hypothetical protein
MFHVFFPIRGLAMSSMFQRKCSTIPSRAKRWEPRFRPSLNALEARLAPANSIFNETFDGDLTNSQSAPTHVRPLSVGTNSLTATLGSGGGIGAGDPEDWFTIHVPTGMTLNAINLANFYGNSPEVFLGVQKGTSFVGDPALASPYLGYVYFGTAAINGNLAPADLRGADLLKLIGNNSLATGSQGFTPPLSSGDYTFVAAMQGSAVTFQLDFIITSQATATTTTLAINPQATTGGAMVTLTATVSPSPGSAGSVTFLDNGTPIPGGSSVAISGGVAVFTTTSLAVGTHSVSAAYSGATSFAASTSATKSAVINAMPAIPNIVSVTPNGNIQGLAGPQRSRVVNVVVVFNQAVELDANAMRLALHTNNVSIGGVAQPGGYGSLPTNLVVSTLDNVTWTVYFSGNTDAGIEGFESLKDGVYDLNIGAARVHPRGTPSQSMTTNASITFHRLFGDTDAPAAPAGGTPNADFQAIVNTGDNLAFRTAFNNSAGYRPFFDFNGDAIVNTGDNFEFRNRFNKPLTWSV